MKPIIATLLCALAAVPMLSVPAAQAQMGHDIPLALLGVHKIVCLGDSITQGGEAPGGYVWLVRKYLSTLYPGVEVINSGISGHKSNDMLARFDRDVLAYHPDMVTISVGVNDVWHGFYEGHPLGDGPQGVSLKDYRQNVEAMVAKAKAANVRVVVLSTTVIHEDLGNRENAKLVGYNAALRDIAHENGALFIDLQRPFHSLIKTYRATTGARDNLLTVDGVHMNPAGNRVMANAILNGLGVPSQSRLDAKL